MNQKAVVTLARSFRSVAFVALAVVLVVSSTRLHAQTGTCSGQSFTLPFSDVSGGSVFFCSIAEAYFAGLTNGTGPTTYSPTDPVPREQMAAFMTRTLDQSLRRVSRRAALNQFWTPQDSGILKLTNVGTDPLLPQCDGEDVWVPNNGSNTVSRVRTSDGQVLETWTGASAAFAVVVASGKIFVTGNTNPGRLYSIDPAQPQGAVTVVSSSIGVFPQGIAYDGLNVWTANPGSGIGSVTSVNLASGTVTTFTTGFSQPNGILYDGSNIWITDVGDHNLKKLNSNGTVALVVNLPNTPGNPANPLFDGLNIWVPTSSNKLYIVRAAGGLAGLVLATLTGNGLNDPQQAVFDGERILVTNATGDTVSLFKAADFSPLGFISTGANSHPIGACTNGVSFWIALNGPGRLARF
jgi:hypothetical protein